MPAVTPNPRFDTRLRRLLLVGAGSGCVGLAVLGVFLPVLPTTPFLLLAAACYARSSERLHGWLWHSRWFGPLLQEWDRSRTIPPRARVASMLLLVLVLGSTLMFALEDPVLRGFLGLVGLGVLAFLWLLPRPPRSGPDTTR